MRNKETCFLTAKNSKYAKGTLKNIRDIYRANRCDHSEYFAYLWLIRQLGIALNPLSGFFLFLVIGLAGLLIQWLVIV